MSGVGCRVSGVRSCGVVSRPPHLMSAVCRSGDRHTTVARTQPWPAHNRGPHTTAAGTQPWSAHNPTRILEMGDSAG